MKKIGIISFYYKLKNYGGLLQAYAMVKSIEKLGYSAEQICYDWNKIIPKDNRVSKLRKIKSILGKLKNKVKQLPYSQIIKKINIRNQHFENFEKKIIHSIDVYDSSNIRESVNNYNTYLAGSDQIWNLEWYRKEFFLEFVPQDVYKFSYAASMPDVNVTNEQREIVKKHLEDFKSVSVRENATANFLSKLTNKKVECVLDPTLLLGEADWNEICNERIVKEKYIFCYFLGKNTAAKKEVAKFAKKNRLKIVTLPHLNVIKNEDFLFGDYRLYDVGPEKFISLIKYSEYVFTDSFHAAVFSNIYKTKYFVFNRSEKNDMSERIVTLLGLFDSLFRYINNDTKKIYELMDIPVSYNEDKFTKIKNESIRFLRDNLERAY